MRERLPAVENNNLYRPTKAALSWLEDMEAQIVQVRDPKIINLVHYAGAVISAITSSLGDNSRGQRSLFTSLVELRHDGISPEERTLFGLLHNVCTMVASDWLREHNSSRPAQNISKMGMQAPLQDHGALFTEIFDQYQKTQGRVELADGFDQVPVTETTKVLPLEDRRRIRQYTSWMRDLDREVEVSGDNEKAAVLAYASFVTAVFFASLRQKRFDAPDQPIESLRILISSDDDFLDQTIVDDLLISLAATHVAQRWAKEHPESDSAHIIARQGLDETLYQHSMLVIEMYQDSEVLPPDVDVLPVVSTQQVGYDAATEQEWIEFAAGGDPEEAERLRRQLEENPRLREYIRIPWES